LAFLAGKGAVVDAEGGRERGFVDMESGQGLGIIRVADRVTDVDGFEADDGAEIAGADLVDFLASESFELEYLQGALPGLATVTEHDADALAALERARLDAADGDAAHVVTVFERGHPHLEPGGRVDLRLGHLLDDHVE